MRTIRAPRGPALSRKGRGCSEAIVSSLTLSGSWIFIGTQGIFRGADETFAAAARAHVDGSCQSVERRPATKYLNEAPTSLDDALDTIGAWRRTHPAQSIGLEANGADVLPEILQRGVVPDVVTDRACAHDALNGDIPHGMSLANADVLREHHPEAYVERSMQSMARRVDTMLAWQSRGAVTFDDGNNIRAQAKRAGVENAFDIRGFVPEYVRPLFGEGTGRVEVAALSGDPDDIHVTDEAALEMFADDAPLCRWIPVARERVACQRRHSTA